MSRNIEQIFADFDVTYEGQFKKYLGEGKKVAGTLAAYCPNELIHAAGIIPLTAWGFEIELNKSKEYFPAFYSTVALSTLEKGLLGDFKGMEFMIINGLTDTLKATGQNWKRAIKEVPFINLAVAQNRKIEAGIEFNTTQIIKTKEKIEALTGCTITDEKVEEAIKLFNDNRRKLQEFVELVPKHLDIVSASRRTKVIASSNYMEKSEHNALLDELIEALKALPDYDYKGTKVVSTGIISEITGVLKIFDDNDIAIVADNILQESGYYNYLVEENSGNPLRALAMILSTAEGTSILLDKDKKRADFVVEDVKKYGADGVIMVMLKFCDSEEFDYPIMKKRFDGEGLMSLVIEVDQQMESYEQANTLVQTFVEMI
ncbi:MAG: R-phenyllactate dehydratase, small subunit [Clostridiales bacterium]|nr:MAG: R-phenyllactate dehydratase, small subunit [Clostridiales bacterium]